MDASKNSGVVIGPTEQFLTYAQGENLYIDTSMSCFGPTHSLNYPRAGSKVHIQNQASGFMVGGNNDKRFLWSLQQEIMGNRNRSVQGNHFLEHVFGMVVMAFPINLAALYHHEKPFGIVQGTDSCRCQFGQGKGIRCVGYGDKGP
jgi:hypothetical protein